MKQTPLPLKPSSLPQVPTCNPLNISIGVGLAIALGILVYQGASLIDPYFYTHRVDVWFQGDLPYRFEMMTDYTGHYVHDKSHPAFSPLGFVPTYLLRAVFGLDAIHAVRMVMASVAALWVITLFLILRGLGCRLLDAILFTLLGASSAAFIFWYTVPETYPFGSLGFLLTLGLVLQSESYSPSWVWFALSGALNVGVTLTNIMVSIFATLVNFSVKQTAAILGVSIGIAGTVAVMVILRVPPLSYGVLAIAAYLAARRWLPQIEAAVHRRSTSPTFQRWLRFAVVMGVVGFVVAIAMGVTIPSLRHYLVQKMGNELQYVFPVFAGGPLTILRAIFVTNMVMPAPQLRVNIWHPETGLLLLLSQLSPAGSGSVWGAIAVGLWLALLGLGTWGFFRHPGHTKFRLVLGFSLLGQVLLHLVYGEETFLYSLHFLPLLLVLAAWSVLTRARIVALVLAGLLVLTAAVNNIQQFQAATATLHSLHPTSPRSP